MAARKRAKPTSDAKVNQAMTNLDPEITAKHRAVNRRNGKQFGFNTKPPRVRRPHISRAFVDEDFDT